ncbi:MAG: ABC transporter ATP-binding protein [Oscillospiraceae bacterium]
MENILEIRELKKTFADNKFAINIPELDIPSGAIVGMIGENGAGKTSILRLIMNIYGRESGSIKGFGGVDNVSDEARFKNLVGYVPDEEYLNMGLSPEKTAKAFAAVFDKWDNTVFKKYMDMWQIDTKKRCGTLSKGTKTKVMLALALAHDPKLLILDEPTAGLDPAARLEILDILREFVSDGERSVIFSTHITGDLDKTADYIAMIIDGRLNEMLSADEAQEKYAVVSGEKPAPTAFLIGAKDTSIGYEALALRKDIPSLGNVSVRTPNYEDILVHTIIQNRENRK